MTSFVGKKKKKRKNELNYIKEIIMSLDITNNIQDI